MSTCLAVGAMMLALAEPRFTLAWVHSVERVEWREDWQVDEDGLRLLEWRIRGSGAGMEPGPDAVLRDGWWVSPGGMSVPALVLALSSAPVQAWRLCEGAVCQALGTDTQGPLLIMPCFTQ